MSAITVLDRAPIGATVEWSDGTPRPPEHHVATLHHWRWNNCRDVLIRKRGDETGDHHLQYPLFMVREGETIRTFPLNSAHHFRIVSRPPVGSVRILDGDQPDALLLHLAEDWPDAVAWLDAHALPNATPWEVGADEVAADHVEGRVAA